MDTTSGIPTLHCFMSYCHADNEGGFRGIVDWLETDLRGRIKTNLGVEVDLFRDDSSLRGGQDWRRRLDVAVGKTDVFIAIVTPAWFNSKGMEELNDFRKRTDFPRLLLLPLPLAGSNRRREKSPQEEQRFIAGYQASVKDGELEHAFVKGYDSEAWRGLIGSIVSDIEDWWYEGEDDVSRRTSDRAPEGEAPVSISTASTASMQVAVPSAASRDGARVTDRRPPFSFAMLGIPIGAELSFTRDKSITCTVADTRNHVMYQKERTSLSAIAQKLLNSNAEQGPAYFEYDGELLVDRRARLEGKVRNQGK